MSHQTGITANATLVNIFGSSKKGDKNIRLIKISIENEELTSSHVEEVKGDWQNDYDKLIKPIVKPKTPCFILYRLDEKNTLGFVWLLLSYIPDDASVREKMLYASTKATLKNTFGSSYIKEEIHASNLDEVTLEGYFRSKRASAAPTPLTNREEELMELKKTEIVTDINTESRQQALGSIKCPISSAAVMAIHEMMKRKFNYLQFKISLEEEKIHLAESKNITLDQLSSQIPKDHARYHIYLFEHTHEGDFLQSYVFIYSMPGYSCTIKERMMYSSCKSPFLDSIEQIGLEIVKKLEIDEGDSLTEEYLQDELHPKVILHRPQFAKPKGPPNRGAKRLTKVKDTE